MGSVEQRARELLESELTRSGFLWRADRQSSNDLSDPQEAAVRAIVAALREQPEARGVVDDDPMSVYEAYAKGVNAGMGGFLPADTESLLAEAVEVGTLCNLAAEDTLDAGMTATADALSKAALTITNLGRVVATLTAAQQPVQEGGGDVWRCFHCDEVFTDPAAAADHFGTKIRHDPACTIDPAEFRRLQDRESDYAEEDAACHRAMRGMETQHRLALEREEIKGYERGLRDSGKCPCAAPPSAPVGVDE